MLPSEAAASQPVASLVRWSSITGSRIAGVAPAASTNVSGGVGGSVGRMNARSRSSSRSTSLAASSRPSARCMRMSDGSLVTSTFVPAATRWLSERDIMSSGWSDDSDNTVRPVLSRIVALACVA